MTFTEFLNLFKYEPEVDGAQTFNIQLSLNDNWDKIATWAKTVSDALDGIDLDITDLENAIRDIDFTVQGEPGQLIMLDNEGHMVACDMPTPEDIKAAKEIHEHGANDITSGTLPVKHGGTGVTSNPSILVNLASASEASIFASSPRPGVTGTLPVVNGGTGVTSLSELAAIMGSAQITKGNYTGNDKNVSLTFPFTPKFVVIYETSSTAPAFGFFIIGSAKVVCYSGGQARTYLDDASISGNTFTSSADYLTYSGETYYYVAFG